MRATGAGVIKLAVSPNRLCDTLPLIDVAREGDAVVIGMGDAGFPSRALAGRFGSRWTYAGNAVAPGQVPAERMVREYGFRRVTLTSRLFGVVSTNAMHSLSPAMHNAAFAAAGIDAVYVPLPTSDFADFLAFADAIGIDGVSVTIPFKLDALRAAAAVDDIAARVGAANTLRRTRDAVGGDEHRRGRDSWLRSSTAFAGDLRGSRASVLGAGGAARAVDRRAARPGCARSRCTRGARSRPRQSSRTSGARSGPWPPAHGSWDLLVNCTPLGGAGKHDESPLPGGPLRRPAGL